MANEWYRSGGNWNPLNWGDEIESGWNSLTGKKGLDTAAQGARDAQAQANALADLQWQRQMMGLQEARGQTQPYLSLYDKIYGTQMAGKMAPVGGIGPGAGSGGATSQGPQAPQATTGDAPGAGRGPRIRSPGMGNGGFGGPEFGPGGPRPPTMGAGGGGFGGTGVGPGGFNPGVLPVNAPIMRGIPGGGAPPPAAAAPGFPQRSNSPGLEDLLRRLRGGV